MRPVPEPLYGEVRALSLAIANATTAGAFARARGAMRRLRALYRARRTCPDPFLTETLADFAGGARTAAKLYRLAIAQSASFPDEDVTGKKVALAGCLAALGHFGEARALIAETGPAVEVAADSALLDEWREVERRCASRDRPSIGTCSAPHVRAAR